jgi:hypothetical protein
MLLHNISTAIILMELRNRVFDQIDDPEPQYDACLSNLSGKRLLELGAVLQDTPITTPAPKEVR